MKRVSCAILACLFVWAGANGSGAQSANPAPRPPGASPAPPAPAPPRGIEPGPPPFDGQLMRLAEVMGSLSFLRDLCLQGDGAAWRRRMSELMDAEATTAARKEVLAGAFNQGYRGFETSYRVCTPSAKLAIDRLIEEGGQLARAITSRYGG